jgi:plastocyanin
MRPDSHKSLLVILVVITALAGCAGRAKVQSAAPMSSGGNIISIEASNFKFSPVEIQVEKPGLLAIEVKNVSKSEHNFTLKDLRGKILTSVAIHPGGSVIVNVELPEPGVYKFYCNKRFHSTLGMKGQIRVGR